MKIVYKDILSSYQDWGIVTKLFIASCYFRQAVLWKLPVTFLLYDLEY